MELEYNIVQIYNQSFGDDYPLNMTEILVTLEIDQPKNAKHIKATWENVGTGKLYLRILTENRIEYD